MLEHELIEEDGRFKLIVSKDGYTVCDYISPSNRELILKEMPILLRGAERVLDEKINS